MSNTAAKKFDVIVLCQVFYPELVSTGQTLTELVEELSELGLRIKVIAAQPTILENSKPVEKKIIYKNIEIVRTFSTRFSKTSFWGKFLNLYTFFVSASLNVIFRNPRSKLMLLTNPPYLPLLGWINYVIYHSPFGVVLFDIMPEQAELLNVIKPNGLLSGLWKSFNKLWYKKASYVVVLSKDMLEGALLSSKLKDTKYENKARAKTEVIHMWSDDRIIKPMQKSDSTEAMRLGVMENLVIQYSGNLGRFHDIETLLGIVEKVKDNKKVIFQFIGEGQKKRMILEFQKKLDLTNIYVSTYVKKDLLPDSLAMSDLGVVAQLPGQERVCYPSKLLGVMAAGKPVLAICPRSSEMAQMIEKNRLGFVIENGDIDRGVEAVLEAQNHPELIKEMGQNSATYLQKNFTLRSAAKKYHNLIFNR